MLQNIFLFKGKSFKDLEDLGIYSYPQEIIKLENKSLIRKIISGHDQYILNSTNNDRKTTYTLNRNDIKKKIDIDAPVPQIIDGLNIFTTCVGGKYLIGLIFENNDNPFDFKEIFQESLIELLNNEESFTFEEEIEIENLLITLFIDVRRFGEEIVEKYPEVEFHYSGLFTKIFLFGLDEAGKTSLIRRIKTGEFNDNYFVSTRKFNIEYIQEEKGNLVVWDMPGNKIFRKKWLIGLQDSNLIIFMIDVANQLRFEESKEEFWKILNRYEIAGIPLLVLGNKVDLISPLNKFQNDELVRIKNQITKYFEFDKIKNRDWQFLCISVKTNINIKIITESLFRLIKSEETVF